MGAGVSCIHLPTSLADASAIVECAGGPEWRSAFVLGLVTVLIVGGLLWAAVIALRATR